jgi:hypothetical protein
VTNTQDYAHHLKGLSPIGAAAARFAIEKPGLSMPQKDRVAAAIGVLDKMNRLERNVVGRWSRKQSPNGRTCRRACLQAPSRTIWSGHRSTIDLQRRRQIDAGTGGLG